MGGKKGRISLNCYRCGKPREKGREKQAYCRECHNAYMRDFRLKQRQELEELRKLKKQLGR